MLYCQDLSSKSPRPDLTSSILNVNKISISINGIKLSIRVEKETETRCDFVKTNIDK